MEVRHLLLIWRPPPHGEIGISFGHGVGREEAAQVLLRSFIEVARIGQVNERRLAEIIAGRQARAGA